MMQLSQAIIYPLELIRTRLAVSPVGTYRGIAHCARMVLRQEGWLAFYRGLVPSMVRTRPCLLARLPAVGIAFSFELSVCSKSWAQCTPNSYC